MNSRSDSNIYEFNAATALAVHADHIEGTPNGTLAVVSTDPLPADARAALASSADKLGFGRSNIFWITCAPAANDASLDANGLQGLLIACDPLALITTDAAAAHLLGHAFSTECPVDAQGRIVGRDLVAFASFQNMLASPEQKQRAWALLKKLG